MGLTRINHQDNKMRQPEQQRSGEFVQATGKGSDEMVIRFLRRGCGRNVTLTINLHLVSRLRISGTIIPFPSMSSWCGQGHLYFYFIKGKGKVHPITGHEGPELKRYSSPVFLTSGLYGGGWSTPRPGRFTAEDPVPIIIIIIWIGVQFRSLPPGSIAASVAYCTIPRFFLNVPTLGARCLLRPQPAVAP